MIDMRRLDYELTDEFIGCQHRLDRPFPSSMDSPAAIMDKYKSDPIFHVKVRSLVAGVMDIVSRNLL